MSIKKPAKQAPVVANRPSSNKIGTTPEFENNRNDSPYQHRQMAMQNHHPMPGHDQIDYGHRDYIQQQPWNNSMNGFNPYSIDFTKEINEKIVDNDGFIKDEAMEFISDLDWSQANSTICAVFGAARLIQPINSISSAIFINGNGQKQTITLLESLFEAIKSNASIALDGVDETGETLKNIIMRLDGILQAHKRYNSLVEHKKKLQEEFFLNITPQNGGVVMQPMVIESLMHAQAMAVYNNRYNQLAQEDIDQMHRPEAKKD